MGGDGGNQQHMLYGVVLNLLVEVQKIIQECFLLVAGKKIKISETYSLSTLLRNNLAKLVLLFNFV